MPPSPSLLLHFPASLIDVASLTVDKRNVTCLGRSCTVAGKCTKILDSTDEIFCLAIQNLRNLPRPALSVLSVLDIDVMRTLQDIAHGLSCTEKHREMHGQAKQLAYHWIALLILPNFLYCMGFRDPTEDCSEEKEKAIQSDINQLEPDQLWILDKVMIKLSYRKEWQRDKRNDAVTLFFINSITQKLDQDKIESKKLKKQYEARKLWKEWHQKNEEHDTQWSRPLLRSFVSIFDDEEQLLRSPSARWRSSDEDDDHSRKF